MQSCSRPASRFVLILAMTVATCWIAMPRSFATDAAPTTSSSASAKSTLACSPVFGCDTDGDGVPDGVEVAEGLDPLFKDNNLFAPTPYSERLFVMQLYRDFMRREATLGEIAAMTNQLTAGTSRAALIEQLLNTPEHADLFGPPARLYQAYFLRLPDASGYDFWITNYAARPASGWTFEGISEFFSVSDEFKARYGTLNNSQFVTLIYQNVLSRQPEPTGFAFWVNELDSGRRIRGGVMSAFSESPENKQNTRGQVQVASLFAALVQRAADSATLAQWVPTLNLGQSPQALITQLIGSQTYRNRFLENGVCTYGTADNGQCIPPAKTRASYPNTTPQFADRCFSSGPGPCFSYPINALRPATFPTGVQLFQHNWAMPNQIGSGGVLPDNQDWGSLRQFFMERGQAVAFRVTTPAEGVLNPRVDDFGGGIIITTYRQLAIDEFSTTGVSRFFSISETPGDFDRGKWQAGDPCFGTGTKGDIQWHITNGSVPAGVCKLKPNTVYYINVRNENAAAPSRTDTCGNVCGVVVKLGAGV